MITKSAVDTEMHRMRKQGQTLEQIGERFGITKERVRQRIIKAERALVLQVELGTPTVQSFNARITP